MTSNRWWSRASKLYCVYYTYSDSTEDEKKCKSSTLLLLLVKKHSVAVLLILSVSVAAVSSCYLQFRYSTKFSCVLASAVLQYLIEKFLTVPRVHISLVELFFVLGRSMLGIFSKSALDFQKVPSMFLLRACSL